MTTAPVWLQDERTPALIERYKKQGVHIVEKSGWFWTTLAWLLYIVTFTIYKREHFLEDFATTIGNRVGFPPSWSYRSVAYVMPHEARHVWQSKACGLFISAWVGLPLFFLLYILLPIPLGFAWFRYFFEKDATRATIKELIKQHEPIEECLEECYDQARYSATRVASADYLWSVPKQMAIKGYRKMVRKCFVQASSR